LRGGDSTIELFELHEPPQANSSDGGRRPDLTLAWLVRPLENTAPLNDPAVIPRTGPLAGGDERPAGLAPCRRQPTLISLVTVSPNAAGRRETRRRLARRAGADHPSGLGALRQARPSCARFATVLDRCADPDAVLAALSSFARPSTALAMLAHHCDAAVSWWWSRRHRSTSSPRRRYDLAGTRRPGGLAAATGPFIARYKWLAIATLILSVIAQTLIGFRR
jgi:hypothetical protein